MIKYHHELQATQQLLMLVDASAADFVWKIKQNDTPNILARNVANIYVCNTVPFLVLMDVTWVWVMKVIQSEI